MSRRILVIEDDELLRSQLCRQLERHHWVAQSAAGATEALALLSTESRFDAALVDQNLVGDSGLDLIEPLLEHNPECRVVILTGYGSIPAAVQATRRGAVDYLTKPAALHDLLDVLGGNAESVAVSLHTPPPSLERLEWEHIHRVLQSHAGNISATARALGMHRRTLQRRLRKRPPASAFERDRQSAAEE